MKTLKLRLLRTWNSRGAGAVLPSVPHGQAQLMIARGDAEPVENENYSSQKQASKPKAKRTRKKKPAK